MAFSARKTSSMSSKACAAASRLWDRPAAANGRSMGLGLGGDAQQILTVIALGQWSGQGGQLPRTDVSLAESDFLRAADLETLTALNHVDEFGSLQQAFMRAGVQPCNPPAHLLHRERSAFQIDAVDVGDFQFPPRRRPEACRYLKHVIV